VGTTTYDTFAVVRPTACAAHHLDLRDDGSCVVLRSIGQKPPRCPRATSARYASARVRKRPSSCDSDRSCSNARQPRGVDLSVFEDLKAAIVKGPLRRLLQDFPRQLSTGCSSHRLASAPMPVAVQLHVGQAPRPNATYACVGPLSDRLPRRPPEIDGAHPGMPAQRPPPAVRLPPHGLRPRDVRSFRSRVALIKSAGPPREVNTALLDFLGRRKSLPAAAATHAFGLRQWSSKFARPRHTAYALS